MKSSLLLRVILLVLVVLFLCIALFLKDTIKTLYEFPIALTTTSMYGKKLTLVNSMVLKKQLKTWNFWSPNQLFIYEDQQFKQVKVTKLQIHITDTYNRDKDYLYPIRGKDGGIASAGHVNVSHGVAVVSIYVQEEALSSEFLSNELLGILYTLTHAQKVKVGSEDYLMAMQQLGERVSNGEQYIRIK